MSVTENVMELKNESHPHFRENPQTPPNMESLASAYFSGVEKNHNQTPFLCLGPDKFINTNLPFPSSFLLFSLLIKPCHSDSPKMLSYVTVLQWAVS